MAHFAKLDENNNVLAVHVVNNDVITHDGIESEQLGIDFLTQLHGHSLWKQTSFNNSFRRQYAAVGGSYNAVADIFVAPKPWPSWLLDQNFNWYPPIVKPDDGKKYSWNEETISWNEIISE